MTLACAPSRAPADTRVLRLRASQRKPRLPSCHTNFPCRVEAPPPLFFPLQTVPHHPVPRHSSRGSLRTSNGWLTLRGRSPSAPPRPGSGPVPSRPCTPAPPSGAAPSGHDPDLLAHRILIRTGQPHLPDTGSSHGPVRPHLPATPRALEPSLLRVLALAARTCTHTWHWPGPPSHGARDDAPALRLWPLAPRFSFTGTQARA